MEIINRMSIDSLMSGSLNDRSAFQDDDDDIDR